MNIRFGVSPIAWINDDMPELGGGTTLEQVLGEARDIGFAGIELGGAFPRDPQELAALLARFQLALVGGWYGSSLLQRSAREEIAALQPHLALLKALGCGVFIQAETSNAIHGDRSQPLSRTPRLSPTERARFGARVTEVADYVTAAGLRFAYHHHLGTIVETGDDLEWFLRATGPAVGLTLDTGHATAGRVDPVALIRTQPERIAHVHCKDVRAEVFAELKGRDGSFLNGVLAGMFTVPGDGEVDFGKVMGALAQIGYSGWVIVEAEQDPALANPRVYAERGLATLRREAAAAGFRVGA